MRVLMIAAPELVIEATTTIETGIYSRSVACHEGDDNH